MIQLTLPDATKFCCNNRDVNFERQYWTAGRHYPHFDSSSLPQSITIRLAESIPAADISEIKEQLQDAPHKERNNQLYKIYEKYLDQGFGPQYLKRPEVAGIVVESLDYLSHQMCDLHSWVIMPTHLHLCLTPKANFTVKRIIQSFKSFTGKECNRQLHRYGPFWYNDYFDRYIRDSEHYDKVTRYIHRNPVKAGLVVLAQDWEYSSARELAYCDKWV